MNEMKPASKWVPYEEYYSGWRIDLGPLTLYVFRSRNVDEWVTTCAEVFEPVFEPLTSQTLEEAKDEALALLENTLRSALNDLVLVSRRTA